MSGADRRQAEALRQASFADASGGLHRLAELTGALLLVNLWASWCPGCREELQSIGSLARSLGPAAIDVVLLSHALDWRADQAFVRAAALPFRHWRLAPAVPEPVVAAAFRMAANRFPLPQTVVFAGARRLLLRSGEGSQDWAGPEQARRVRGWLAAAG